MSITEISDSAYCEIISGHTLVDLLLIVPGNSFNLIFDANSSLVENKPFFFQTDEEASDYYSKSAKKAFPNNNNKSWQRIEISDNETKLGIVIPFYGVFLILYMVRKSDSVVIRVDFRPYKNEAFERLDAFFFEETVPEESLSRIFEENMLGDDVIHVVPGIVIKKERLYTCTRITEGLSKDPKIRDIWISSIFDKGPVRPSNMYTIGLGIQQLSGDNSWQDVVLNPAKYVI